MNLLFNFTLQSDQSSQCVHWDSPLCAQGLGEDNSVAESMEV